MQHRPHRDDTRRRSIRIDGQPKRHEPAVSDIHRIEPQNIVRKRRMALHTELRSHDAGDDQHMLRVVQ